MSIRSLPATKYPQNNLILQDYSNKPVISKTIELEKITFSNPTPGLWLPTAYPIGSLINTTPGATRTIKIYKGTSITTDDIIQFSSSQISFITASLRITTATEYYIIVTEILYNAVNSPRISGFTLRFQ